MDRLSRAGRLANTYRVMRHGQSKANASGIIVSSIDRDRRGDFGLTELGREQVLAAARSCELPAGTVICSSDFARGRQTAEIIATGLGAAPAVIAPALRERYFGDFDGSPVSNYARVWAADQAGEGADHGIEPAQAVFDRMAGFVADLERRYRGRDILLVSHGDPLQILQAGLAGIDPARHRGLPQLETAEIRRLQLVTPPAAGPPVTPP
jgi:glucosyl-3-phosphoglycerate phosphatase